MSGQGIILNCITVDDEPLALNLINTFVEQTPFLNLKGSYANGIEALQAIHSQEIDLIILDIQMPHLNGMELARVLTQNGTSSAAKIIFTTAYNQFALEAFKVNASDYLLKPFGYEAFLNAAMRVKNYFELLQGNTSLIDESEENCMFVKADYKLVRVDFDSVLYLESSKDNVKIHLIPPLKPIITLSSLKSIEDKLPPSRFLRLHRSFIISLSKVDSISKNAVYIGTMEIAVGELYRDAFKKLTGNWI
ncbi:LytTR family DNA-binding domain-containing protein [Dyadobacter sp. 3J3]|uniref:LytR/AlgR family response regulator transcription factor n=1 Tax=Dyadobacter sp. 3J3 TaxID=2606600 RepID=UPI00286E260B|nr:LytTR family DNA-binding domain-containing protein [Dyadobacter sp. 3J3]